MRFEIKIDASYTEPEIVIFTSSVTEEVENIVKRLSSDTPKIITGIKDGNIEILNEDDFIKIYSLKGRVSAATEKGEYSLRMRLYEIEEKLCSGNFVRISNSEIINLKKVKNFDLSFTGTILVRLSDGSTSYVSRRYISKIKKILGF